MTTEITSYNQLNTLINAQYDAIDGDLQRTATSSRQQAALQAQLNELERQTPPPTATPEERAEFLANRDATIATIRERISDLEATQDPSWIVDRVAEHLETVQQAKASYDAYLASRSSDAGSADRADFDDAPLEVGSLNLPSGFNISSLSAADLTGLISALFETGVRASSQAAVREGHLVRVKQIPDYQYQPLDTSTAAGASITEQLQALEWAPPELLSIAGYAASLGLQNSDLSGASGLPDRLSGQTGREFNDLLQSAARSNDIPAYSEAVKTKLLNVALADAINRDGVDLTYEDGAPPLEEAINDFVDALPRGTVQSLQLTIGILSGRQPDQLTEADRDFVTGTLVAFIAENALWDEETGIDSARLSSFQPPSLGSSLAGSSLNVLTSLLAPLPADVRNILTTTLSDGQNAAAVLAASGVGGAFRGTEFWNQVADELYVRNVSSSLEHQVYAPPTDSLTEDHPIYDLTDPRAAQELIQGLSSLLDALEKAEEEGDEKAGELLSELQTLEGQQKARDIFLVLTQIITASAQTAEVIIENTTPSEEEQIIEKETRAEETRTEETRDVRRLDDELTAELALAAADYYYDSTTTDDSAQANVAGPGAGRDDIITVRLAQALIDANPDFFESLANDAGLANSELLQTLQSQADANTARDFTPSFI